MDFKLYVQKPYINIKSFICNILNINYKFVIEQTLSKTPVGALVKWV